MKEEKLAEAYFRLKNYLMYDATDISHETSERLFNDLTKLENALREFRYTEFTLGKTNDYVSGLYEIRNKIIAISETDVDLDQEILPRVGLSIKVSRDLDKFIKASSFNVSDYFGNDKGIPKDRILELLDQEISEIKINSPINFLSVIDRKEIFVFSLAAFLEGY